MFINAVGVAAAICSMSSFVPQALKIRREKDASSVSFRMYAVTVAGFTLWTIYGFMLQSWPLIGSNLISLGLAAWILALKVKFGKGTPLPEGEGGARREAVGG